MHRSTRIMILFVCAILLSGCASSPETSNDPTGPDDGLPVGGLAGNETVRLEDCHKAMGLTAIAMDWAEPYVPEGFRLRPLAPEQGIARFGVISCDRAIFSDAVETDIRIFYANVEVEVMIEGVDDRYTNLYLDIHTTSTKLKGIIEGLNGTAEVASIQQDESTYPDGVDWEISGDGYTILFTSIYRDEYDSKLNLDYKEWIAGPPNIKFETGGSHEAATGLMTLGGDTGVVIQLEGESRSKSILGDNSDWVASGAEYRNGNYVFTFTGGYGT